MKRGLRYLFGRTHFLFFLLMIGSANLSAQILTNGNFESGGSGVGFFVHDYTLINPVNGTSNPGFYARTKNPALMNSTYNAGGDHTTGTGNMLVFDGSNQANRYFWTTGDTGGAIGGFTAGTTYTFSFWIKSVSNAVTTDDATRASIGIFMVNANNMNPANPNFLAPLPSEGWVNIQYSFVATANNVMVRLKTNNAGPIGNDFAVDDFSITVGALPFVGSYTSLNPTCPTSTDGSITVNLAGGTLPYTAYTLTGSATMSNNSGIFNGLGEGTYNVSVSDSAGHTFTQTGIVLEAPNNLVLSAPVTACPGDTTPLTVSGGTGAYTWTASPADISITNPNSATQNVSPSVTTTYTVTSGTASAPVNLIQNSDFSLGNAAYITEYLQVADPNPFGIQTSYNIVTNPNAWFTAFSACGDNTTGSGNMMVFDGATNSDANVIAWSNQTPVAVTPNTDYTFTYHVASVSADSPARLEVFINGVSQGVPVTAPGTPCVWNEVSYNWNSGSNTTATFVIIDKNVADYGNDFALDDITFREAITCVYQKSVTVTVAPGVTPTFNAVAPICAGETLATLPTTSTNAITGTWSPALDNTTTTTYTFTPDAGQCAATATLTITVNQPTTVPTFAAVAPICAGDTLAALPTTSDNGITGTWAPALNNTATTTYTFTPAAGQCAATATLTITVNDPVMPTFATVAPICAGETLAALPTTSNEGITGTWSPALNNTATTTYTFTAAAGQCASNTIMTITVNAPVASTFASVAPICSGETLAALPTTSIEGFTGIWSPALNNTATTTYTFTPDAGQCASNATLTITVNQPVVATFAAVDPVCAGSAITALPTTSIEGFTGTWSPALDNTATTTYTFTPDAGQCAAAATLTITVNELPDFTISEGCEGNNYTLAAVQDDASNSQYAWYNTGGTQIGSGSSVVITAPGVYELVITRGGCSNSETINVLSTTCFGEIQRGISPNHDGLNDFFDLEAFDVKQLQIFNRYGMNVYTKANYQNEWYGQSDNGNELPDGTYFYVIDFADSTSKTGWIYSNRQH
ncbi:mucin 2, oligomeric mucus/gel-forming [Flavobacterium album]|uniref:Mucin 2, oligomeric mucus/gel-forming n=1 Tax=Flavobacterium album TaxID=2175091 RepID=A0A2S1QXC6_9FLAO|nr:gliding motility-associated C-terminal domain-containing protein [Flavobacterium album]AWH85035.1 mucin 2, oligomeric mucus/gel-forming [Flavobacterium album]